MEYEIILNGSVYNLPIVEVGDGVKIALFDMLSDAEMAKDAQVAVRDLIFSERENFDVVLSAEAKGIPLALFIAQTFNKDVVICRKSVKPYFEGAVCSEVSTFTSSGISEIYADTKNRKFIEGKKVLLVDDVISTGQSLVAMESIVEQLGGEVTYKVAVLAEGPAAEREDIKFVTSIPLF